MAIELKILIPRTIISSIVDAIALLSQVLCKFWEPDDQNPPIITERILLSHVFLYLLAILSYLCLQRSLLSYTPHCVYAFISLEFCSCKNCSFKSCFSYFFASTSHFLQFVSKTICGRSIAVWLRIAAVPLFVHAGKQ